MPVSFYLELMNKLTIVMSGKKQSGKSSMCNHIRARFLNARQTSYKFSIDQQGNLLTHKYQMEKDYSLTYPTELETKKLFETPAKYGCSEVNNVKVYSFADPLKKFCIDVMGVPWENCYGTDEQKNTPLEHLLWENIPKELRLQKIVHHPEKYIEFSGVVKEAWSELIVQTGCMSGRDLMQFLGTDVCRRLYGDCWARGTYNLITNDGIELALVADARFPNEITMGNTVGAKTVRLLRNVHADLHQSETALDNFPQADYTVVMDNQNLTLEEQCQKIDPYIDTWFKEAGI